MPAVSESPRIAVVTPARNERGNLIGVLRTLSEQRQRPDVWVIVDDASADGSYELAVDLAMKNSWIRVCRADRPRAAGGGDGSDRSFITFRCGVSLLSAEHGGFDLLMKLDADTRLPASYVEVVAGRFREDRRLGIASGVNASEWSMGHHIRGNNRVYLWDCWNSLDLPDDGIGWDTIDIVLAKKRGWKVELFTDLVCHHLRGRSGDIIYSVRLGKISRHLGYFPLYAFGRAVLTIAKQGPIQATSYLLGYLLNGGGSVDPRFRLVLREDQVQRVREFISHPNRLRR